MLDGESPGAPSLNLPARPAALAEAEVAVWREPLVLPTHAPSLPDRYPAYLDRRVYQGSSGRVYPMPFTTRVERDVVDRSWDAVHLENRWMRLVVLPQLGGRLHVARDLTSGVDLFYANPVIKPALVGLAGPWLAGGVEFNWPQHHRPATFLPTDVAIDHETDGSVTVWCSDHDPFTRMKGMHGIRLRPGRAAVEVRARLHNRTELPQTFLWWANVAARVDDDYQSFFPRDVRVVADHAKRAVTSFPSADRPYYGVDYAARRDRVATATGGVQVRGDRLDWYRNIPVPTSYMCTSSRENFFGGYDHASRTGFVHVADTAVAVGKKQWTWGDAAFGHAWDRNLSDDGAHYVELMAGVFTDNQPDFAHLAPGETKVFTQTWFPLHDVGPVHAATTEAAVRVDVVDAPRADDAPPAATPGAVARVGVVLTTARAGLEVVLSGEDGVELARASADGAPGSPVVLELALSAADAAGPLTVSVRHEGDVLVLWSSRVAPPSGVEVVPATEPPPPVQVATVEELALVGAHLDQYRHATRSPQPYWREALRRDPGHVGSRVASALAALRRDEPGVAEDLLRPAVARLTRWNPNPADTTALYALGLALERQGRDEEAYDSFARSSWARPWRAPAGYRMARLDAAAGRDAVAQERLDDVLRTEPEHLQARALRVVVLRRTGEAEQAEHVARTTLAMDPLHWWTRDLLGMPLETDAQTCLDVALEHAGAGELDAALRVLGVAAARESERASAQPAAGALIAYHRAHVLRALGRGDEASEAARRASRTDAAWCFPVRCEDAAVLRQAAAADTRDARAPALLGHWLYAKDRHADAVAAWRRSAELDPSDPVVWRNLALAAHDRDGDPESARRLYDRALETAPGDPQLLYESDQLDARRGVPPERRLRALEAASEAVAARDDLAVVVAHLLLTAGRLGDARELLLSRTFQPWEGGEGEVLGAWDRLCQLLARRALAARSPAEAALCVESALDPPASLGEARHPLASTAPLQLLRGEALAAAGDARGARAAWAEAADAGGDFRGMALQEHSEATASCVEALRHLGREHEARALCEALRQDAGRLTSEPVVVDYFATSLPSLLLFDQDLGAAQGRRAVFRRAQLDVLDDRVDDAVAGLLELLTQDPGHVDATDLLRRLGRSATDRAVAAPADRPQPADDAVEAIA